MLIASLFPLVLSAGMPLPAQEVAPATASPILTLDRERLFAESRSGQAILRALEEDTAQLAAENRGIEADLIAEERALTERRATLPPDEFRALAEAFDAKVVAIRRQQDAKARALAERRESDQQAFFRNAMPVIAELVRETGGLVVLDRGAVLLSAEQLDITEAAIARIDAAGAADGAATEETSSPNGTGD